MATGPLLEMRPMLKIISVLLFPLVLRGRLGRPALSVKTITKLPFSKPGGTGSGAGASPFPCCWAGSDLGLGVCATSNGEGCDGMSAQMVPKALRCNK